MTLADLNCIKLRRASDVKVITLGRCLRVPDTGTAAPSDAAASPGLSARLLALFIAAVQASTAFFAALARRSKTSTVDLILLCSFSSCSATPGVEIAAHDVTKPQKPYQTDTEQTVMDLCNRIGVHSKAILARWTGCVGRQSR